MVGVIEIGIALCHASLSSSTKFLEICDNTQIQLRLLYCKIVNMVHLFGGIFLLITRNNIYAIARICHGNSVCPSVCHTAGSVKSV